MKFRALVPLVALLLSAVARAQVDAKEVEDAWRKGSLEAWFPRIVDRDRGGFLCDFDDQWNPRGEQTKSIVFQARHVWLASMAAIRFGDDPRYRAAADHGYAFLRDVMWDKQHGGFYFKLDSQGAILPQNAGVKHAYGIAFGIYALAAYHQATGNQEALDLAAKAFAWLDKHGHDAAHGGYHEYFTRQGQPILSERDNPVRTGWRVPISGREGFKSMNAHIHLLEALTALHLRRTDDTLKARTREVLEILRDKVVSPAGTMHQYFAADWTPVPDVCSFGHDVETAYLLTEAAEALGLGQDARTRSVAKSLVDHALDIGWDSARGGFFETGGVFGPVHDKRKIWWSQAEGLNALLLMARTYPDDPRRYRALFEKQWQYIKANLIDARNGDWYGEGLDSGGNPRGPKATEWKCGYHNGRAMMNVSRWLAQPIDK